MHLSTESLEICSLSLNINYSWLSWVFAVAHRFSLVVASRGYSLVATLGRLMSGLTGPRTWAQ